jgi:xanthine dehydrogenase accessory factor
MGTKLDTASVTVVVRGGGDLGTGVAWRLHRCGFRVLVTETEQPTVIRRAVAFASAVRDNRITVDGVTALLVSDDEEIDAAWSQGVVPVAVDSTGVIIRQRRPDVVVDAILAKENLGTRVDDAPSVIALGPGFTAGVDCHAVVETNRGHNLGRVILQGSAEPNTGVPGTVGGEGALRVLRAPVAGVFQAVREIGDRVQKGEAVAYASGQPIRTAIDGVVRGLLAEGLPVTAGMKVGDVDPRGVVDHCFTISEKALAIGGGVLEAILYLGV